MMASRLSSGSGFAGSVGSGFAGVSVAFNCHDGTPELLGLGSESVMLGVDGFVIILVDRELLRCQAAEVRLLRFWTQ